MGQQERGWRRRRKQRQRQSQVLSGNSFSQRYNIMYSTNIIIFIIFNIIILPPPLQSPTVEKYIVKMTYELIPYSMPFHTFLCPLLPLNSTLLFLCIETIMVVLYIPMTIEIASDIESIDDVQRAK